MKRRDCWLGSIALALSAALSTGVQAAPRTPKADSEVLEHLPNRADPTQRELSSLRAAARHEPSSVEAAASLSRRYITLARNDADPRYLGYAQAAIGRWWNIPNPPPEILVLRATILQSSHHFTEALADLDALLRIDRTNAQAWITRATVLQVRGDFEGAKKSCAHLFGIAPDLILRTCMANANDLSGSAKVSYLSLKGALDTSRNADPAIREWILTLLGEMAQRLGDAPAAERSFREALALSGSDTYLLGSYTDFLLDQGRWDDVAAMLKDKQRADGLLLRYALALDAKKSPDARKYAAMLRDRFDAAMQRGDTVHQREQSRFELHLMRNPQRALVIAQQNWAVQREPADARAYLEAAAALRDPAAAKPALDWLREKKLEDAALEKLKKELEVKA